MKKMKFNRFAARSVKAGFVVAALVAASGAFACTVDNWSGRSDAPDGAPLASGPNGPDGKPAIARYSGVCAMQTVADTETWVEDNSPGPGGIDRIRARFYVLANNSADAVIYRGFDGGGSGNELFNLQIAADGAVSISSGSISIPAPGAAVDPGWNSVEIDWNSGGEFGLTINGQSVPTSGSSAAGSLASVRLGNLNGATGTLNFDAYESRRSTPVGQLCVGDADGNGAIRFFDVTQIFEEVSSGGNVLASGQPDVDENGEVRFLDVAAAFELVSTAVDCP